MSYSPSMCCLWFLIYQELAIPTTSYHHPPLKFIDLEMQILYTIETSGYVKQEKVKEVITPLLINKSDTYTTLSSSLSTA